MDLYLIDAKQLISEVNNSLEHNPHSETKTRLNHNHEHLHFLHMISQQCVVDPETLQVVQELRGKIKLLEYQHDLDKNGFEHLEKNIIHCLESLQILKSNLKKSRRKETN